MACTVVCMPAGAMRVQLEMPAAQAQLNTAPPTNSICKDTKHPSAHPQRAMQHALLDEIAGQQREVCEHGPVLRFTS